MAPVGDCYMYCCYCISVRIAMMRLLCGAASHAICEGKFQNWELLLLLSECRSTVAINNVATTVCDACQECGFATIP
jgi:hypothetical protein